MQSSPSMLAFVSNMLAEKIPPQYYYHNLDHTLYVTEQVEHIARHEQCTENEIILLKTAALWHDSGFIETYSHHEQAGCVLARQYLPGYNFAPADIDIVCDIIMATKMPQSPGNKLEEIMADADLEYLGTPGVKEQALKLFKELQWLNAALTEEQWHKTQVSFLQHHSYFTPFCKQHREPLKQAYLSELLRHKG